MKPWKTALIFLVLSGLMLVPGCTVPQKAAPGPGVTEERAAETDETLPEVTGIFLGDWVGARSGPYRVDRKASRAETARKHGRGPGGGILLKIEAVSVEPSAVRAGETVELAMTYAVLPPGAQPEIDVTEKRQIDRRDDGMAGNPRAVVRRTGGTYRTSLPVRLSLNADAGAYRVIFIVEASGASDRMEAAFTVK